ncbi:hypothetical protein D3C87_1810220 [compost metagenome]
MVSLLKPWRFCLKMIGPGDVALTAIAAPSITGHNSTRATTLKKMSKPRLATESQSAMGLSKISSIGTSPTWE